MRKTRGRQTRAQVVADIRAEIKRLRGLIAEYDGLGDGYENLHRAALAQISEFKRQLADSIPVRHERSE
jgi:hypothetical protein